MLPDIMRYAAENSTTTPILVKQSGSRPKDPVLFGSEPEHGSCYPIERTDLARQTGDWQMVAALRETAFALDNHLNDPA